MLRRHEEELNRRIDEVAGKGFAYFEWWELYAWYDMDRISKNVWRDLESRFDEASDGELLIYETAGGILLIRSNGLKKISSKALSE